jgi:ABC-type amino acid transport substrate-binding protein
LDIDDSDITKYFGVRLPKDLNDLERFLTEIDSVLESGKYKEVLKRWEEDYL